MADLLASSSRARSTLFTARPYSPEGGFPLDGLIMLLVALAVSGVALGLAAHYVGKLIYLILIFPAAIGAGLGFIGQSMVQRGHIRDPWVGAAAGLLGGVFAMFVMHYANYLEFRAAVADKVPAQVLALGDEDLRALLVEEGADDPEQSFLAIRAMTSFPSFVKLQAKQGVEISNHGSKGLNIGYWGSLIYWLIEILLVAGIALAMMRERASMPYCAACAAWKKHRPIAAISGDGGLARTAVETGDVNQLAASAPVAGGLGRVMLHGAQCATCKGSRSSLELKLIETIVQKKGEAKTKTLAHASWPGEALAAVEAACAPEVPAMGGPITPITP